MTEQASRVELRMLQFTVANEITRKSGEGKRDKLHLMIILFHISNGHTCSPSLFFSYVLDDETCRFIKITKFICPRKVEYK